MSINRVLVAAAAASVLLAGCGSKSTPLVSTTSSTSTTTTVAPASTTTTTTTAAPAASALKLSVNGLAGMKPGQSLKAASAGVGHPVTLDPAGQSCSAKVATVAGVTVFMTDKNTIWAIYVMPDSGIATDKGIKAGSTEAEVKAAYPSAALTQASYGPKYVVTDPATKHELLIELDDSGKVNALLSGLEGIQQQDEFCG